MPDRKVLNVFIASPGDVQEERQAVHDMCGKLNENPLVKEKNIYLESFGWEQAMPQAGNRQEIINQVVNTCDLFVCLFHRRFGSATGKHPSGTLEEFLNAYESWKNNRKPQIFLYFKEITGLSLKDMDDPQLRRVMEFKQEVEDNNLVLKKNFKDTAGFTTQLETHLQQWITTLQPDKAAEKPAAAETSGRLPPAIIPMQYENYILEKQCGYMDIRTISKDTKALRLHLPEVYIPLFTADHKMEKQQKSGGSEKESLVNLEEMAARHTGLVIKGEAGSGKTTLLKHLTWSIIRKENPFGLNDYLPVLVFLRNLKRVLPEPLPHPCAGSAEKILHLYLEFVDCGLDLPRVKSFCRAQKLLLLLDGLDEVDDRVRDCLVESFTGLARRNQGLKLVFSGRPHGIRGKVCESFPKRIYTVRPFDDDQIAGYVKRWWIEAHDGDKSRQQQKEAEDLIRDLAGNRELDTLKRNPLMLTAICFLYMDQNRLPDQRADLYDRFVQRLLVNRFPDEHKRLSFFFMELAYIMFKGNNKVIDRIDALEVFKSCCRQEEKEDQRDWKIRLEEKFDLVEAGSGLMRTSDHQYTFSHLSIQEYLTAAHIKNGVTGDHYEVLKPLLTESRYENVIRLYVGLLSITGNKGVANRIVENILNDYSGPEIRLLAGNCLLDLHKDLRNDETTALVVSRMQEIIDSRAAPAQLAGAGEIRGIYESL